MARRLSTRQRLMLREACRLGEIRVTEGAVTEHQRQSRRTSARRLESLGLIVVAREWAYTRHGIAMPGMLVMRPTHRGRALVEIHGLATGRPVRWNRVERQISAG